MKTEPKQIIKKNDKTVEAEEDLMKKQIPVSSAFLPGHYRTRSLAHTWVEKASLELIEEQSTKFPSFWHCLDSDGIGVFSGANSVSTLKFLAELPNGMEFLKKDYQKLMHKWEHSHSKGAFALGEAAAKLMKEKVNPDFYISQFWISLQKKQFIHKEIINKILKQPEIIFSTENKNFMAYQTYMKGDQIEQIYLEQKKIGLKNLTTLCSILEKNPSGENNQSLVKTILFEHSLLKEDIQWEKILPYLEPKSLKMAVTEVNRDSYSTILLGLALTPEERRHETFNDWMETFLEKTRRLKKPWRTASYDEALEQQGLKPLSIEANLILQKIISSIPNEWPIDKVNEITTHFCWFPTLIKNQETLYVLNEKLSSYFEHNKLPLSVWQDGTLIDLHLIRHKNKTIKNDSDHDIIEKFIEQTITRNKIASTISPTPQKPKLRF